MTVREELVQRIADIARYHHAIDPAILAEKIVDEWYDSREEWVDKLISRSEGDIDLLSFLVEKYPDGDEDD